MKLQPNLPRIGPALGRELPQFRDALSKCEDPESLLDELENGRIVDLEGMSVTLDDVQVVFEPGEESDAVG